MATHHNFKIKNGLEVGGTLIVNSSGQLQAVTAAGNLSFGDGIRLYFGNSNDLEIVHTGGNNLFQGFSGDMLFKNFADNRDIKFMCDDGSGGVTEYFMLDGSQAQSRFLRNVKWNDSVSALFGTSDDLSIQHNGTDSKITNNTGNLEIRNNADDKDIVLQSDDGSGGIATYFMLDGSQAQNKFLKNTVFLDDVKAQFGTSADFGIKHDGSHTYLQNSTGHVFFQQLADDQDIVFQGDDGSGGVTEYLRIDGSDTLTRAYKTMLFQDNVKASFGNSEDMRIKHDGTNGSIDNYTGDLLLRNNADDKDIVLQSDNGSGGLAEYIRLDGSAGKTLFSRDARHSDNVKGLFGGSDDLEIYHDATNTHIKNATGDLVITNNNDDIKILSEDDVVIGDNNDTTRFATFTNGGAVTLFHNGNTKFATTSSGASVTGNLAISGDLTVDGTNTVLNTTTLDVEDKNITLNKGSGDTSSTADGAGITIQDAVDASNDATFLWNASTDTWRLSHRVFAPQFVVTDTNAVIFRNGNHLELKTFAGYNINLNASGKVGIGTTSPNSPLHLLDDNDNSAVLTTLGNTADRATIRIENDNNATGAFASLFFRASTADAKIAFRHTAQNRGDLIFILDSTGGTPVERMRLKDTGSIGIGTNDPKGKLHILNNEDNSSILTTLGTTADESSIRIENTSTATGAHASLFLRAGTGDSRIAAIKKSSTSNDVDIAFILDDASAADSKERMRIVGESGNVGIGTATPSAGLHLFDRTLRMQKSAGDRKLEFIDNRSGANHYSIEHDTSQIYFYNVTTTEAPLKIRNNGSVIMSAGNIGIGTGNSPARKLEVMNGSGAAEMAISGTTSADLYFKPNVMYSAGGNFGIKTVGDSSSPFLSTMTISGYNNGVNDIMTLKGDQKVGINKTAPSTPLHVTGTIRSQMDGNNAKYINLFGGNSGNFIDSHGNALFLRPNATTNLSTIIRTDGTVGISNTLDVDHDMDAAVPTSVNSNIFVRDTNAVAAENGGAIVFSGIYTSGGSHLGQGPYIKGYKVNANSGDFGFGLKLGVRKSGSGGSNVALTIDDDSKVGIGTATPSQLLEVVGAGGSGVLSRIRLRQLDDGSGNAGATVSLRSSGFGEGYLEIGSHLVSGTGGDFNVQSATDLVLKSGGNNTRVYIASDGKVGIGATPNANVLLHVQGVIGTTNGTASAPTHTFYGDPNTGMFRAAVDTLAFTTGGTERVRINSSGNVGIGETSIDANLHITHSNPNIKFEIAGQGKWAVGMPAGQTYLAFDETNDALTTPTMVMTKTTKRVGIGTTSPTELLEVNGNIKADTLKVDNITFKDVDGSPTDEINLTTEFDGSNSTLSFEGSAGQLFSVTNDLSGTFFSVNDVSGIPSIEVVDDGTVKLARFSGDVGIGTGSPNEKLHIQDSSSSAGTAMTIQNAFGESPKEIKFRYTDTVETARITAFGRNNTSNRPYLAFSVNQTSSSTPSNSVIERMRIDSAGNVGIGNDTPLAKLDVTGQINIRGTTGLYLNAANGTTFRAAFHDDGTRTRLFADGNGSNPHMTFNGGNVGVGLLGTNHPTTRFHVQGSGATVTSLVECTDGNQASLDLKNSEGHFRLITDGGGFFFYDQTDSRQPFTINSSGHVLIGTTNTNNVGSINQMCIVGSTTNDEEVAYVLNVMEGSNNRRAKFFLDDDLGEYGLDCTASSGVPRFVIRNATAETFTVTQQGRVGIGEPSPDNKVEAKGTDAAFIAHYSGASRGGVAAISGQRVAFISTSVNDDLVFGRTANPVASSGFVERMRIDNGTGHVGIGTTSPGVRLQVNSGTTNRVAKFTSTDATAYIQIADSSTTATSHGYGATGNDLSLFANDVERMRIKSDGKIGIGTTNPGSLLTVEGNIAVGDNDEIRLGASADLKIYHDGSNSYIDNSTADLRIRGAYVKLQGLNGENMLVGNQNGAVELYHDNSKKLETTSTGVTVTGLLSATTKSFDIPHPTKEGMRLRYGVLEGPENGVYVRGKSDGYIIKLPEVWKGLVHEDSITVQLTAIGKPQDLYVENIEDNTVYLGIHPGKPIGEYYYYIQAERKDVEKLEVEYGNPL